MLAGIFPANIISMIYYCPYCSSSFPNPLKNGVCFCQKCERVIESNKKNELLSAFRGMKKLLFSNYNQMKFELILCQEDVNFLCACYEDQLSFEEFEKELVKYISKTA